MKVHLKKKKLTLKFRKAVTKWKDCHGTLTYKDGSKYVGEFKDGKFSGQGTFTYKDGTTYFGEFIEGKSNGDRELIQMQMENNTLENGKIM